MPFEQPRAHVPWNRHTEVLSDVLNLGLVPEIAFKGPDFDDLDASALAAAARALANRSQRPTVHAPFFDLNPGALDPLVREVTRQRLTQALTAAGRLGACLMVVHPGYDRWRYPGLGQIWAEQAAAFFTPLVREAERLDCRLAVENIYEETPDTLLNLVGAIDSRWFGHCFDIGHWHLFGTTPLTDWLQAVAPRLLHLHLHDNHGTADEHLPVGSAAIDFDGFFSTLRTLPCRPTLTLEAHNLEDLQTSLAQLTPYLT